MRSAVDTIVGAAAEFSGDSTVLLYLLTEDGLRLELQGAASPGTEGTEGPGAPVRSIRLEEPLGRWIAAQNRPVEVSDLANAPPWRSLTPDAPKGPGGCVLLPLSQGGRPLGALLFLFPGGRGLSGADLSPLKAFAASSSALLEKTRRPAEAGPSGPEEARLPARLADRKTQALEAIGRKILEGLDAEKILTFIARSAAEALPGCFIHISLLDSEGETLRLAAAQTTRGDPPGPHQGLAVPPDGTLAGWVARHGRSLVLSETDGDPRWASDDWQREAGITSYAGVPLLAGGQTLGVLSCFGGPAPGDAGIDLLRAFADQAAIALHHARLQQDLRTFKARLLRSERHRTLGAMMRGVAHDFNNLLGVILTRAQLLMLDTDKPETVKELENIEQASYQGAASIRRILEFTKSAQDVEVSPVDLASTVEEVVAFMRGRCLEEAEARGVRIDVECRLPTDLPPVQFDGAEIREVIAELINNAIDAMREGGSLFISAEEEDGMIILRFTDTGVGMDEATRDRIFEPYFTTKGIDGSGLGLSNVLSIVQRIGGHIDVKSVPGHGTTVSIFFPLERSPFQEVLPFSSERSARILVVEEKPEVLELLERVLRMDGHEVAAVSQRGEALEILRNDPRRFDLVMTDRRKDGKAFSRAVRSISSETPVVFFSGWGQPGGGKPAGGRREADLSLAEPFSIVRVVETVRETLRRHAPRADAAASFPSHSTG
ncbi:MAG: GAF domain-containing protein [Nitrospinota bacterium]